MTVTLADLHWTAGALDAKGSFATWNCRPIVRMGHKKGDVLDRLKRLYGGALFYSSGGACGTYIWCVVGSRAIALALTLFTLMSERRKREIASMVKAWMGRKSYRHDPSNNRWGYRHAR